jgi:hypothetical protein
VTLCTGTAPSGRPLLLISLREEKFSRKKAVVIKDTIRQIT